MQAAHSLSLHVVSTIHCSAIHSETHIIMLCTQIFLYSFILNELLQGCNILFHLNRGKSANPPTETNWKKLRLISLYFASLEFFLPEYIRSLITSRQLVQMGASWKGCIRCYLGLKTADLQEIAHRRDVFKNPLISIFLVLEDSFHLPSLPDPLQAGSLSRNRRRLQAFHGKLFTIDIDQGFL